MPSSFFRIAAICMILVLTACSRTASNDGVGDGQLSSNGDSQDALVLTSNAAIASSLGRRDKAALSTAEADALNFAKQGETVSWNGRSASVSGTVGVSSPFRVGKSICRSVTHKVLVSGKTQSAELTACKQPQSGWKLVT